MKFIVNKNLFPYQNRFIKLSGGHHIHYIDEGNGPLLLMLHGNPTWSFLYRKLIAELKDNFRCIAPDLPGFGLSEAPQDYDFSASAHSKVLEDFIKALKIESFIMIGQDWGGPLGLHLATRFPEKVKGAILGNTGAY